MWNYYWSSSTKWSRVESSAGRAGLEFANITVRGELLQPPPSLLPPDQTTFATSRQSRERERDVRRTGQRKLYGVGLTYEDLFLQRNLINVWRIIIFKETWYSVARHWCDVRLAISAPFTSLQVILEMRFANFLWNFNKEGEQTGVEPAASQSGCLDLE